MGKTPWWGPLGGPLLLGSHCIKKEFVFRPDRLRWEMMKITSGFVFSIWGFVFLLLLLVRVILENVIWYGDREWLYNEKKHTRSWMLVESELCVTLISLSLKIFIKTVIDSTLSHLLLLTRSRLFVVAAWKAQMTE